MIDENGAPEPVRGVQPTEGGAAQKRDPILVFSVHATLTENLLNNSNIGRSLPKVGKAITKLCCGPRVALGIAGDCGGTQLGRGE